MGFPLTLPFPSYFLPQLVRVDLLLLVDGLNEGYKQRQPANSLQAAKYNQILQKITRVGNFDLWNTRNAKMPAGAPRREIASAGSTPPQANYALRITH